MLAPPETTEQVGANHAGHLLRIIGSAILFWASFVFFANTYSILRQGERYTAGNLVVDLPLIVLGTLLGTAVGLLLRMALRRLTGFGLPAQITVTALFVALACLAYELIWEAVILFLPVPPPATPSASKIIAGSIFLLAPMGLWAAIQLALFHHAETRARERRLASLQIEAHEAQVRALRYQVNPHFLYNVLNSVAALILDRRNDEAEQMVLRLAEFFRGGLARDPLTDVMLAEEIASQRRYLEVEQLRFGDALTVEIDVPAELEHARLPSLILQPLVENALKHGARDDGTPLRVRIGAERSGDRLILEVHDNGMRRAELTDSIGTGTGLRNVASRLINRFGDDACLKATVTEDGFAVRLDLPWEAVT